jgi:hypothetical protein
MTAATFPQTMHADLAYFTLATEAAAVQKLKASQKMVVFLFWDS